ncbi:MAG: fatty acid desaturase family protein [Myxococcaceae bacterium]|nr:fatty acid desaturase family protein [Myxococcaceae bacterium]
MSTADPAVTTALGAAQRLTREELTQLSQVSAVRTWLCIARMYAQIAATFAVACLWPHPLVIAVCFVLMARHQKALATLSHDGAHRRLFVSRKLNDYVSQICLASAVHLFADGYRRTHLRHHRKPLAPDDPDIGITGGYPITRASFFRKLLRDLFGITWVKFVRHFIAPTHRTKKQAKLEEGGEKTVPMPVSLGSMLAWNAIILTGVSLAGHPLYYPLLWLLPQITVLQVILRIRGIAEHAGMQPHENQELCTRTVRSRVQAWFFAPNNINFHIEHHLYPGIPWFNLRKVHRLLEARGALPPQNVVDSYADVLRLLIRDEATHTVPHQS